LTVCNSIILAEALRRRRASCNAITNTFQAGGEARLELYRHLVRSLAEVSEPFEEVAARAHRLLLAVLDGQARTGHEAEVPEPAGLWARFVRALWGLLR